MRRLECRICMGSRESAEISVVQCEMRYTRMLQRLCDPKCIQRIGDESIGDKTNENIPGGTS
jgi:hypothetical protein